MFNNTRRIMFTLHVSNRESEGMAAGFGEMVAKPATSFSSHHHDEI